MNTIYLLSTGINKQNIKLNTKDLKYHFLSLNNHTLIKQISLKPEFSSLDFIYTSNYVNTIEAAIYFQKNIPIITDNALDNIKYGLIKNKDDLQELERREIKDFDYKVNNSESINDVKKRVSHFLKLHLFHNPDTTSLIITHKINIIALLSIWCTTGLNYDDEIIMTYKDTTIIDGLWHHPLLFKLTFDGKDLLSLEKIPY